jgi:hypothetical protein
MVVQSKVRSNLFGGRLGPLAGVEPDFNLEYDSLTRSHKQSTKLYLQLPFLRIDTPIIMREVI